MPSGVLHPLVCGTSPNSWGLIFFSALKINFLKRSYINQGESLSHDILLQSGYQIWFVPDWWYVCWMESIKISSSWNIWYVEILILNVRGPSYLGLTSPISLLLMSWLLTLPGHQQQWYWLCRICRSRSYLRKDFKYMCHINVGWWHKM